MQLDKTAVVITQRNLDELLDLSLAILRRYGSTLLGPAFVGMIPFAILNTLLLGSRTVLGGYQPDNDAWPRFLFLSWMAGLVYVESPLAMAGVTMSLGNTMFGISNTPGEAFGTLRKQWVSVVWILSFLRGVIPLIALIVLCDYLIDNRAVSNSVGSFWIFLLLLILAAVRSFRPFAPEILLLERCKMVASNSVDRKTAITYSNRAGRLHQAGGELFGSTLMVGVVACVFLLVLNLAFIFLIGSVVGAWAWGWWMDLIFYPLALWAVAFWGTIVRFLIYMNTRIRGEGWELELKLKAEARRFREAEVKQRV